MGQTQVSNGGIQPTILEPIQNLYTGSTIVFTVTVASKDSTHRYNGQGSSNGYKIDGKFAPFIVLTPGITYKFDQADGSNSGHPLRFYKDAAKVTAYTTNVTTNGTAGSSGAYTQIVTGDATPTILYYQCSAHGFMGNAIQTNGLASSVPDDGSITTAKLADEAVTLAKLEHGTSSNNGKFLRANNGADPTFETITVPASINNLVEDTSPQLGGDLASNGNNITLEDSSGASNNRIKLGAGSDLQIYHNGTDSTIYDSGTGRLKLYSNGTGIDLMRDNTEAMIVANTDGSVELYHDNSKKLETSSSGITVNGAALVGGNIEINQDAYLKIGASNDLSLTHSGGNSYIENSTGYLFIQGNDVAIRSAAGSNRIIASGSHVDLFYGTSGKLSTISTGVNINGGIRLGGNNAANELDDYEEGTWTPSFSQGFSLTNYRSSYTKIGRLVTAYCYIRILGNFSNNNNTFEIHGLPFNASQNNYHGGGFIGYMKNSNYSYPLLPLVYQNNNYIYFHRQDGTTSTFSYQDMHNVGNGYNGEMIITMVYETST